RHKKTRLPPLAKHLPSFRPRAAPHWDRVKILGRRGANMRQSIMVACASAIFLLSFAALYLLVHAQTPAMRGLVGGGLFSALALALLWKDGVRLEGRKRPERSRADDASPVGRIREA